MRYARSDHEHRLRLARHAAVLLAACLPLVDSAPAMAETMDRIRDSGTIKLGYRTDARPFSYQDDAGKAAGYAIAICEAVSGAVKSEAGMPEMAVEWVPVTVDERFSAVRDSKVDLLCGPDSETLERRKEVSFSLPVFRGGIGALVRADASIQLREVLSGRPPSGPTWRGSPARILAQKTFSAVAGTRSESWLAERIGHFKIAVSVAPVDSYEAGIARVLDRSTDVFFADRAILVDAAQSSPSAEDLLVIERQFTHEPVAFALGRNDDDFRLVVDRALSHLFGSQEFRDTYLKWFGEPDEGTLAFFRATTLPE